MTEREKGSILKNHRILVVEDDYMIAESLKQDLQSLGAEVIGPVSSVEQAIACIAQAPWLDAAVLDINLGSEMVFPVANDLSRRAIPFVFLTGYNRSAVAARYADVPVFEKPVEPVTLAKTILAGLGRKASVSS